MPDTGRETLRTVSRLRAKKMPATHNLDTESQIDMRALRAYRLGRLRAQLAKHDVAGILLYDPINVRYATGSRNMQVWTLHNAARYCFVPAEGPVTLFDFHNCEFLSAGLETVQETRTAISWFYFMAGPRKEEMARKWAAEIADLVKAHGGGNRRLAVDKCDFEGVAALAELGITVVDGQGPCELARVIKSPEEIACMNVSVSVCEVAMSRIREAVRPGVSENELWAVLNQVNAQYGGEWIETRLLASGGRTNPWFQEASDRRVRAGELVSFDTDMIGPYGYCADLSRSFLCGHGRASDEQRRLYGLALEQIQHNLDLLRPGLSFREMAERSFRLPDRCQPNRYSVVVHGVGLCDEYPAVVYLQDFEAAGYDGHFEPGMAICVESYMGEVGGEEGVKLEQQVVITDTGIELLSTFPFEEELMPDRWV